MDYDSLLLSIDLKLDLVVVLKSPDKWTDAANEDDKKNTVIKTEHSFVGKF